MVVSLLISVDSTQMCFMTYRMTEKCLSDTSTRPNAMAFRGRAVHDSSKVHRVPSRARTTEEPRANVDRDERIAREEKIDDDDGTME